MKRILVISSYPAPYRVAVFRGLAGYYELDIFFEFIQDQSRSSKWFAQGEEFKILNTPENRACFQECLRHLERYDLILAYDYNNVNAGRLIRTCIRKKKPYVINCDGAFINRHWLKDRVKRYYISHARACFASGIHAEAYFLHYGARKENIYFHGFTSLHAGDILKRPVTDEEKRKLCRGLGLTDRPLVLTIGQFIPRKGFDVLLDAWKDVSPEAQLVLLGGGELEAEYREQIRRLGLDNVVLQGFAEKERVFQYYRAADLFVLPTREDIWGLVINEAMACALPVVSTKRCIAASELIVEGENGYVVPVGDALALAGAITRILSDDSLRDRMAENNLEKIRSYTLENIVEKHRRVIGQL